MARYDMVLKGGTVLDPSAGVYARGDVAVAGGLIAAVAPELPSAGAGQVFDAEGLVVTPGLIDFHVHAFWGGTDIGMDPDEYCLPRGVTTVVDGGSSGAFNFLAFRRLVIERARSRVLCFLNLSTIGQVDIRVGELSDLRYADPEALIRRVAGHRDVIVGLKVRLSRDAVGAHSLRPLEIAREVAEELDLPIMIHIGETEAPLADILALARAGDIVTHILTGRGNGILEADGRLIAALGEARQRGVLFDVGQGRLHLSFRVAAAALAAGFIPDIISSDLTIYSARGVVRDLPTVMNRFLALGLSLEQVVARATVAPAQAMGRETEMGSLRPGMPADLAVFSLEQGDFEMVDSAGESIAGRQRLVPRLTMREGRVVLGEPD